MEKFNTDNERTKEIQAKFFSNVQIENWTIQPNLCHLKDPLFSLWLSNKV